MSAEQRNNPRMPLDVKINLSENAVARSKDISVDGIGIITEKPLAEKSIITLTFFMPDTKQEISAYGKIRWVKQVSENFYEHGIEFWDIQANDKKIIEDFFS